MQPISPTVRELEFMVPDACVQHLLLTDFKIFIL